MSYVGIYFGLKLTHIVAVILSGLLFFVRGIWHLTDSRLLLQPWVKILPHVIDTILLFSAISLLFLTQQYPFVHNWLTAKLLGLILYIGLGIVAFRFASSSKAVQFIVWCMALVVFAYIISVAFFRDPWPFININVMQ